MEYYYKEIDSILKQFLMHIRNENWIIRTYFQVLYETGCRPSEPLDIENWKISSVGFVSLRQNKNDRYRLIELRTLPEAMREAIAYGDDIFKNYSLLDFVNVYNKYSGMALSKLGGKRVGIYIFRHNRIKLKFRELKDIKKVVKWGNWYKVSSAENYIDSKIYPCM